MGRAPCCDKANVKRGPWSPEEDATLKQYLHTHGTGGNWIALPQKAGLRRCGKSCRLRWLNYLRPDIKHGGFTEDEDNVIITLYNSIGSRWSVIASHLPGRTDNDVKNYWNTKLKKKLLASTTKPTATSQQCSSTSTAATLVHQHQHQHQHPPPLVKMEDFLAPTQFNWEAAAAAAAAAAGFYSLELLPQAPPLQLPVTSLNYPSSIIAAKPEQDSSAASSSVENWSTNGGGGSSRGDEAFFSDIGYDSYSEFLGVAGFGMNYC